MEETCQQKGHTILSNGVKPSSTKKAVQKPQSKPVVETPLTRTEKKRNKGFEKWLESFKARNHQKSKDDLGPIFDEEEEPFDYPHQGPLLVTKRHLDDDLGPIFDEEDDHLDDDLGPIFDEEDDHLDDDSGPIFDEEEEPEAVSVFLAVQKMAEDVVDSGPEADHEKDLTTAYASGDILGTFSSDKLVQTFVCKEYDPVKLLRHEEGLQHFIFDPGEETPWLNGHFMGLIGSIHEVLEREKLKGLMQNVEALFSIRNQCLDLSKKDPPKKYKPWSYNISI
ncbi:hypothetical protein DY000_02053459 [Brassica cretica]|uniref:Uncharacterized protein n=1 Tax=Brassica cretica TaxID=69181 RepID=A0ABQ7A8W7_BRACR|nr:hypothetical protein DY000_02053459 [Brassica cretica]